MVEYACGHTPKSQRGAATLLVAVVLTIAVVGITFLMSDVVIREKQFVANEYRAKQAFHAAQGGLDYAIAYLTVGADQDDDGTPDTLASSAIGTGRYELSLTDLSSAADASLIEVHSRGFSDDSSVIRDIYQAFGELPILGNPPAVPVVAKGTFYSTGNLSVTNNSENITIWTGIDITSWGSSNTYINIDGNPDQLSTTKNTTGPDVIDGDQNLANASEDELLQNFFGLDWDGLEERATRRDLPADPADASGLIYLDSDTSINGGTWGSVDNPVILVVDGELTMVGNVEFYGVIVTRDLSKGAGTPVVNGGIVATGDVDFGAGNFSVIFNETVMSNTNKIFVLGTVNGSWRDWN
jgi:hypothetical protein